MIEPIIREYNHTVHHTTKFKPVDAHKPENEEKIRLIYFQRYLDRPYKPAKFKIGDKVRLYRFRGTFTKRSGPQFTTEIFTVKSINDSHRPITYQIEDEKNEPITGCVYEFELTKSNIL